MSNAVLLMAYGSPRTMDEVGPYLTDIRGGRMPSEEGHAKLVERYRRIGGPSPLNEITARQAKGLERSLGDHRVYVGMKHWHPFISDAVNSIVKDGVETLVGLVLAPHYSAKSIGEYEKKVSAARDDLGGTFEFHMVQSWWDEPKLVEFIAAALKRGLEGWDADDPATRVFFTAHSIPTRIIESGDPYARQLEESARVYADAAGIAHWEVAWQSASQTGEPWIGPDIIDSLTNFAQAGGRRALVAPVGFTADHLEILFDIDVECAEAAESMGLELRRTNLPNDEPGFIDALADVVRRIT